MILSLLSAGLSSVIGAQLCNAVSGGFLSVDNLLVKCCILNNVCEKESVG